MRHATTNYKAIKPFIEALDEDGYGKFISGEYMPFVVERMWYSHHGSPVYSIAHYGELDGDLMADPEMTIAVDDKNGTVEPLTFQNDYMGMFQKVYGEMETGVETYKPYLRNELDNFLRMWLRNVKDQRFTPQGG